jgi:hypothetical protein
VAEGNWHGSSEMVYSAPGPRRFAVSASLALATLAALVKNMGLPPRTSRLLRLIVTAALAALLAVPPRPDAQEQQPGAALPSRVARLARIDGAVMLFMPAEGRWAPATANAPLAAGSAVQTAAQAGAVVKIGASQFVLAGGSELAIDLLDDRTLTASLHRGEVFLALSGLAPGETMTIRAPRGTASFTEAGRYAIIAGDAATPTRFTAFAGSAQVNGEGFGLLLRAGEAATIGGTAPFAPRIGPAEYDPFAAAILRQYRTGPALLPYPYLLSPPPVFVPAPAPPVFVPRPLPPIVVQPPYRVAPPPGRPVPPPRRIIPPHRPPTPNRAAPQGRCNPRQPC